MRCLGIVELNDFKMGRLAYITVFCFWPVLAKPVLFDMNWS